MSRTRFWLGSVAAVAVLLIAPLASRSSSATALQDDNQVINPVAAQPLAVVARVTVPDVPPGSTIAAAQEILRGANLTPGSLLCTAGPPGAVTGRVSRFSPPAGTSVLLGAKVDMYVIRAGCFGGLDHLPGQFHPPPPSPPPPPPPPPPPTPVGAENPELTELPPLGAEGPGSDGDVQGEDGAPAEGPPPVHIQAPATDTTPPVEHSTKATAAAPAQGATQTQAPATAANSQQSAAPSPSAASVLAGLASFIKPSDWEIENTYTLEFVAGQNGAALQDVSENRELTGERQVWIAPTMRVTLEPDTNFEVKAKSDPIQDVQDAGHGLGASWQWDVTPHKGGKFTLYAKVEVLQRGPDGKLVLGPDGQPWSKSYPPKRVDVEVRVGTWRGFLNALKNASTLGDVLGTLFNAWEKTIVALTALVVALWGLWFAIIRRGKKQPETGDGGGG